MSYDHAEYYHLLDKDKIEKLIRINIFGTTHMTYTVLPGMLERFISHYVALILQENEEPSLM
jgi:short-subunit dehydrogenase